jgi:hypothetical protein
MKSRTRVLLVAAAIATLVIAIARHSEWTETEIPMPLTGEAVVDPFYAAERLARKLGATADSVHSLEPLPPVSDVMVITDWNWSEDPVLRRAVKTWVEGGGRLVLDDTFVDVAELQHWSAMELLYPFAQQRGPRDATDCRELEPVGANGRKGPEVKSWNLCGLSKIRRLRAPSRLEWGVGDSAGLQAVRLGVGRGSVTFVDGHSFTGRGLLDGDDALMFVAAIPLARDSRVHFMFPATRQSLSQWIWRNGASALCLAALALGLWLWRSSVRFGPLSPNPVGARRSLGEQIRGSGRFLRNAGEARFLHAATLEALESMSQTRFSGYAQLTLEQRVAVIAAATALDVERLRAAFLWPAESRAANLTAALANLEDARRRVASRPFFY